MQSKRKVRPRHIIVKDYIIFIYIFIYIYSKPFITAMNIQEGEESYFAKFAFANGSSCDSLN